MRVFEFKLKGKDFTGIDEAIRTSQFVRNKCLRLWMEHKGKKSLNVYDLNKYCAVLAKQFPFAKKLNSQARQAAAERAWQSIARFYANCKANKPGKKGFPKFKKHSRSVEYKQTGWKLDDTRKRLTVKGVGEFKLMGTYDLHCYQLEQIKRVRLVRRADGYYAQFAIRTEDNIQTKPTGNAIGLDLGIKYFLADSEGGTVESPKFYRTSERKLNRANRKKSKKYVRGAKPQSKNYHKARVRYARKHLRVSRQRKEFCKHIAYCVIHSNDVVAYEDLKVSNMVKNRHLSKSISDAGWYMFRVWLEYFGRKYGKVTIAVPPHNTSQNCSNCGEKVKTRLGRLEVDFLGK